ncbi:hypothetical protein K402DRAFT_402903 [Aulographum hederae CBS 113979]|uniref:Uncharacterized protein n=1 Tax=Aulographum hederae CBS 113979 TaxID=1176131 RepID=A0A6G1H579_9PEZI|nr:hypothetical protein K402DRAFT_402903 [Aulographum hederae CBS 113979]
MSFTTLKTSIRRRSLLKKSSRHKSSSCSNSQSNNYEPEPPTTPPIPMPTMTPRGSPLPSATAAGTSPSPSQNATTSSTAETTTTAKKPSTTPKTTPAKIPTPPTAGTTTTKITHIAKLALPFEADHTLAVRLTSEISAEKAELAWLERHLQWYRFVMRYTSFLSRGEEERRWLEEWGMEECCGEGDGKVDGNREGKEKSGGKGQGKENGQGEGQKKDQPTNLPPKQPIPSTNLLIVPGIPTSTSLPTATASKRLSTLSTTTTSSRLQTPDELLARRKSIEEKLKVFDRLEVIRGELDRNMEVYWGRKNVGVVMGELPVLRVERGGLDGLVF